MRFQWSSSIPWDLATQSISNRSYTPPVGEAHVRRSLKIQWITVRTWVVVRYTDYCGHLSTFYVNQYIPWDILTRFKSQGPSLWSRKDGLSSCCCGYQCLSVSYSSLVESLRWDRPVHKQGWTRSWTHDYPTSWWPSVRCAVVQKLPENCNMTSGRSLESRCLTRQ